MPSELERGPIEHKHLLDPFPLEYAVLQIAVLLPVEICLALGRHVVEHVLRHVLQVGLHVTRISRHDVVY